jgi:hypothetical protein
VVSQKSNTPTTAFTGNNHLKQRKEHVIMKIDIVTMDELQQFKTEFIQEMKNLIVDNKPKQTTAWLRSTEVRKMLNISPGTLQNLRVNGTLPFRKIGGSMYYNKQEIEKIMKGE